MTTFFVSSEPSSGFLWYTYRSYRVKFNADQQLRLVIHMYTIIRIRNIILDSRKTYTFNRITRIYTHSVSVSIANNALSVKAQHTNTRIIH